MSKRKRHFKKSIKTDVGNRKSAAITRGWIDAKNGVSLADNFYRKIHAPVTMCGYWDQGWQEYNAQ